MFVFVTHFQDLEVPISMAIVMLLSNLAWQRKSASHLCQMVCSLWNMQCNFNFTIPTVKSFLLYSILDYIKYQWFICGLFWVYRNNAFWCVVSSSLTWHYFDKNVILHYVCSVLHWLENWLMSIFCTHLVFVWNNSLFSVLVDHSPGAYFFLGGGGVGRQGCS